MTAYALYILDLNKITTPEEHNAATRLIPHSFFDKLRDIEAKHDVKLHRGRIGFSACKGNTEYIAFKITV